MFRKWMSGFLIVAMVALPAFPALAAVATPANTGSWEHVASPSDADIGDLDFNFSSDSDALCFELLEADAERFSMMSSSERAVADDIINTIDFPGCYLSVVYYDMSGVMHTINSNFNTSGRALITRPSDFASPYAVNIFIGSSSVPSAGKYSCEVRFMSDTGGFTYSSPGVFLRNDIKNAATQSSSVQPSFSQSSGDFSMSFSLDCSRVSNIRLGVRVSSDFGFPYGGYLKVRFVRISSSSSVDVSVGDPPSTDDLLQDNANNTYQISNNTAEMADTLKEIVQTISNQLAALWDQMFNLMHLPEMANWDQNTQKIIDALKSEINVNIENDNDIAVDIMDNDDKNTDTVVNGYDNSKFNGENTKLDSAINEYDQAEDAIIGSVSGYLENFTMPSYSSAPSGVLTACIYYGNYLQRLFEAIGFFNFPITLSLTMIFVLMLIGYHRFRTG